MHFRYTLLNGPQARDFVYQQNFTHDKRTYLSKDGAVLPLNILLRRVNHKLEIWQSQILTVSER